MCSASQMVGEGWTWGSAEFGGYALVATQGVISKHQQVVLEFRMDQTVATGDDPPQVVGKLPLSFVEHLGPSLRYQNNLPVILLCFDVAPPMIGVSPADQLESF